MSYFIGLVLSAIFLALAAFHFYWVSGGKWGVTAAIPASEKGEALFRPGLVATLAVAFGLLAMGVFALIKAGLVQLGLPEVVSKYGLWALAGIFLLRAFGDFRYVGFFKKIKQTQFAEMDTKYYSPLCVGIVILTISLEILTR